MVIYVSPDSLYSFQYNINIRSDGKQIVLHCFSCKKDKINDIFFLKSLRWNCHTRSIKGKVDGIATLIREATCPRLMPKLLVSHLPFLYGQSGTAVERWRNRHTLFKLVIMQFLASTKVTTTSCTYCSQSFSTFLKRSNRKKMA